MKIAEIVGAPPPWKLREAYPDDASPDMPPIWGSDGPRKLAGEIILQHWRVRPGKENGASTHVPGSRLIAEPSAGDVDKAGAHPATTLRRSVTLGELARTVAVLVVAYMVGSLLEDAGTGAWLVTIVFASLIVLLMTVSVLNRRKS